MWKPFCSLYEQKFSSTIPQVMKTPRNLETPTKYKFMLLVKTNTHLPDNHVISHWKWTQYYSFKGLTGGGGGGNFWVWIFFLPSGFAWCFCWAKACARVSSASKDRTWIVESTSSSFSIIFQQFLQYSNSLRRLSTLLPPSKNNGPFLSNIYCQH